MKKKLSAYESFRQSPPNFFSPKSQLHFFKGLLKASSPASFFKTRRCPYLHNVHTYKKAAIYFLLLKVMQLFSLNFPIWLSQTSFDQILDKSLFLSFPTQFFSLWPWHEISCLDSNCSNEANCSSLQSGIVNGCWKGRHKLEKIIKISPGKNRMGVNKVLIRELAV